MCGWMSMLTFPIMRSGRVIIWCFCEMGDGRLYATDAASLSTLIATARGCCKVRRGNTRNIG